MALPWADYLEAIRIDGDRLVAVAAEHLDDPTPWCPGWVGRDVVAHTGVVHRHKHAIVEQRLSENPEPETAPISDSELLDWYRQGLDQLLAVLEATDPATPMYTWYRPDRTAGFWIRRMAHETAIHRADAESTSGAITPLSPALGADGVDEVLGPIMCAYTEDPHWEFVPRWPNCRTAHGRYRGRTPPRVWYRQARCRVALWRRSGRRPTRHRHGVGVRPRPVGLGQI